MAGTAVGTSTVMAQIYSRPVMAALMLSALLWMASAAAQNNDNPATNRPALPPVPAPLGVPRPGPVTDGPYAPQPILPGGIVLPLFPPDSHYLNTNRIREA